MKAQCDMHLQPVLPLTDALALGLYSDSFCTTEALFTLEANSLQYVYLILIQIQELKSLTMKCSYFIKYILKMQ